MTKRIYLGKIVGPHGIRGLFKINFYNQDSSVFEKYKNKIFVENMKLNLEKKFQKGKLTICKSNKLNSIEELSNLIGKELWTDESNLQSEISDEYFHKDLIGLKVYNIKNNFIGKVIAVHNFGAGDLLELDGTYKYMIKFYDANIKEINTKDKTIKLTSC